jgi:integrase
MISAISMAEGSGSTAKAISPRSEAEPSPPSGPLAQRLLPCNLRKSCQDSSAEAFIFPDAKEDFVDTGNYRRRVLRKLARNLELPKLTFPLIRRTIAKLAQKKGTVKDVQGLLRHSRAATTTNVYMLEIPDSVQATINAIHAELRKPEEVQGD